MLLVSLWQVQGKIMDGTELLLLLLVLLPADKRSVHGLENFQHCWVARACLR
jgi:hypothetical protein